MKKLLLILSIPVLLLASCNKKNATYTKVAFYFEDKNATGDISYDLYIDDKYEGKIPVYSAEPTDTSMFLFRTLNDDRHEIDVKKESTYLSATYLQITKNKTSSGTNKAKALKVTGMNGSKYRQDSDNPYSVYAPFK